MNHFKGNKSLHFYIIGIKNASRLKELSDYKIRIQLFLFF